MYFNTKPGVQLTPVGVDIYEHRAGIRFNTRGVKFNTGVFAVCQSLILVRPVCTAAPFAMK